MNPRTTTWLARRGQTWRGCRRSVFILACFSFLSAIIAPAQVVPASSSSSPMAATAQERDDYRAAASITGGAELQRAAHNFSSRYPQSALRILLLQKALRQYEIENDRQGILDAAHDVLGINPGDPQALVLIATAKADELAPGDPEKGQKAAAIRQSAELALRNLERGMLPATAPPQQAALYRSTLQAMAYSALGITKLKTGDDAGAERDLKLAVELAKAHPDASVWYHLALAQEHRKKYSAAINSVEQAMQLASANPQLQRLAQTEHERLYRLAGRSQDLAAPSSSETGGGPPPE